MPASRYEVVVERIVEWTPTTRSLFLALPAGVRMPFTPGQFVSLLLPVGDAELVRPYSLASSPEDELLEICVDLVPDGPGSQHLFGLRPGATLAFKGPYGSFTIDAPPQGELVFVAHGTAIAPVRAMMRRVLERPGTHSARVLHGARVEAELLYRDEFERWRGAHPRLEWVPVLAGPATPPTENPALEALVEQRWVRADANRTRHFWICGVGDTVRRLRELLRGAGYERRAVRYEQW